MDMIRTRSGNYDGLYDWFTDVRKNPLAEDTPKAQYYRQMLPFVSNYEQAVYNMESAEQYMADNGLTWDTVDPIALAKQFSPNGTYKFVAGFGSYLSKNILKLYR